MRARMTASEQRARVEAAIEANADDILRYITRRVSQAADAADLLGHVFLALWEGAARIPDTATEARLWCFGVARNVLREHYRSKAKHLALADRLRESLSTAPPPQNDPERAVEERVRADTVRSLVSALDARSKELIIMVHWDGFSIAEAARLLSMNESSARTRHSRALQRLGVALGTSEPDASLDTKRAQPTPDPSDAIAGEPSSAT